MGRGGGLLGGGGGATGVFIMCVRVVIREMLTKMCCHCIFECRYVTVLACMNVSVCVVVWGAVGL